MKYTFLIPAYKPDYLEESLRSILCQTYGNFNVIVSDDCSPYNLKHIVDLFDDSRITYRRNERNIGAERIVDHWNLLLGLTDAEYVIMASDDDCYDCCFLEVVDLLTMNYPSVNLFRPRVRKVDEKGHIISEEPKVQQWLSLNDYLLLWSNLTIYSGIPYYVFKREPLVSNGGFERFPYGWFSDDASVIKQIGGSGLVASDRVLFSFRISSESISSMVSWRCAAGKLKASRKFSVFLQKYKHIISEDNYRNTNNYIQFTAQNDFRFSGASFLLAVYAFLIAGYAPLRWKLNLIKMSLCK